MKKSNVVFVLIAIIFSMSFVLGQLTVDKVDKGSVVISELNNPAVFNMTIFSPVADTIEIYSLVGVIMSPKGGFDIPAGTTNLLVKAYPTKEMRKQIGLFTFEYQIKGQQNGIYKDMLLMKIVEIPGTLSLEPKNLRLKDNNATISIRNTQNTYLENVRVKLSSEFFEGEDTFSLNPFETVNLTVPINKEISRVVAGTYPVTATIYLEDAKAKITGDIKYLEAKDVSVSQKSEGFIVRKTTTVKTNEGNVPVVARIESKRDILTRLITVYSSEPSSTERGAITVKYAWEKEIAPGESFTLVSTTNLTFPFLLLIFVIIVAVVAKMYTKKSLDVIKTVSYVKTKGGELALRVTVNVRANKFVENVKVSDRLPAGMKFYDKFGNKPETMQGSLLGWKIDRLNAGESRVFSYIAFSKIGIVGRFELPAASAMYEREGKVQTSISNKAFFVAGTAGSEY